MKVFNLQTFQLEAEMQLSGECLNGVHLHPTLPFIVTSSGERHFDLNSYLDSSSDSDSDSENNQMNDKATPLLPYNNSLGIWKLPHQWFNQ